MRPWDPATIARLIRYYPVTTVYLCAMVAVTVSLLIYDNTKG